MCDKQEVNTRIYIVKRNINTYIQPVHGCVHFARFYYVPLEYLQSL